MKIVFLFQLMLVISLLGFLGCGDNKPYKCPKEIQLARIYLKSRLLSPIIFKANKQDRLNECNNVLKMHSNHDQCIEKNGEKFNISDFENICERIKATPTLD